MTILTVLMQGEHKNICLFHHFPELCSCCSYSVWGIYNPHSSIKDVKLNGSFDGIAGGDQKQVKLNKYYRFYPKLTSNSPQIQTLVCNFRMCELKHFNQLILREMLILNLGCVI